MRRNIFLIFLSLLLFGLQIFSALGETGVTTPQTSLTSSQASGSGLKTPPSLKKLTPSQQKALEQELQKTGGVLTPEGLRELISRPEFQGLSPEEVIRAKKEFEKIRKAKKTTQSKAKNKERKSLKKQKEQKEPQEISSLFEEYLKQASSPLQVSTKLSPFGYSLFKRGVSKPLPAQPVAPDYIIGPGDEIQILLWGRLNAQYNLTVGRDGRILIPHIGAFTVAGMRYGEMKAFLTKKIKQIPGTEVIVSLGKLHQIQVFVLGEVKNPGLYNLPAMCTMVDALIAAGGPTGRGSLRRILLKRNNKIISKLDLYNLLLKGDKRGDKRLRHGDIIFVPLAGPLVGVAGNVRRPAIYELKKEKTLYDVIQLAGGLLPSAWDQKIQVIRFEGHERKVVLDVNAQNIKKLKSFTLQDGDLVKVFSIVPTLANSVELIGHVVRPGIYAYHPGMKLSEILKSPEDLLPETYLDYALIKRQLFPSGETKLIPFSLKEVVIDKTSDIELAPFDKIYVFSKWYFQAKPKVTIRGEIRKPGTYRLEKNMKVKDLILIAGGLTKDAYLEKAEIIRVDKQHKYHTLYFNLGKALKGDEKENLTIKSIDQSMVYIEL